MTRWLTLAEAQALECNGCGDCCNSPSVAPHRWHWGNAPGLFAELNSDGTPLIIPLRLAHEFAFERDLLKTSARPGRPDYVGFFTCSALLPENTQEQRLCALFDSPRPETCSGFPVFERYAEDIERALASDKKAVELQTQCLPRCTWYDIVIVAEELERAE